jgi:hypothetical protein
MDATVAHAHLLGIYNADGRQRELRAVEIPDEQALQIIDVLIRPLPEDGDVDVRFVEDRVWDLGECQAIADDYIALAEKLGWPPMPDVWW